MYKILSIICTITFVDFFAIGLTVPLFSNHVRELGGSHFFVGLFGSVYSGIQLFSGPVIGSWSDLRGRKFILTSTLFLSSICYLIVGITSSLYILLLTRIILGFTKHTQSLCKALIADSVPLETRSNIFAKNTAVSVIGYGLAPILGGHLMEYQNGFFYVNLLTSLLFIINIGLVHLVTPIQIKQQEQNNVKIHTEFFKAISDLKKVNWSLYWDIFAMKFFRDFAMAVYFSNFGLTMRETYGVSQKLLGYIISFQTMIGVISSFSVNWISNKFYSNDIDHTKKNLHLYILMFISFLILCITQNYYCFLLGQIPLVIANSFVRITEIGSVLTKTENEKGSVVGTSSSISSLARLSASLSSGLFSDIWGQSTVIYFATFPAAICTILAGVFVKTKKSNKNIKVN